MAHRSNEYLKIQYLKKREKEGQKTKMKWSTTILKKKKKQEKKANEREKEKKQSIFRVVNQSL